MGSSETGGKNPTVVTSSANLDEAVNIVGADAFGVTGQACTATSRVIVHTDIYDEFVEGIVDCAESIDHASGVEDPDMDLQVKQDELEVALSSTPTSGEQRVRPTKQATND